MVNRLILAVAGSGKTTHLLSQLDTEKRSLVLTYTNNNLAALEYRISQQFGFFPTNIALMSYFSFLNSFCFRPLLQPRVQASGISFKRDPPRFAQGEAYFLDKARRLYSNRMAKLLATEGALPELAARLSRYFDQILIDEFQDFAGHDFNLISTLVQSNVPLTFVGDFFQHTYDTSADGAVNKTLHESIEKFSAKCTEAGLEIDTELLSHSHRCSPTVCEFVTEKLGIEIASHRTEISEVRLIEDDAEAEYVFRDQNIVKLFYQQHHEYPCRSKNWGASKGDDHFDDVCVVLNPKTLKAYESGALNALASQTRNKLYVACTRARGDLYFVADSKFKKFRLS